jgi:hypothetical protein
MYTQVLVLTLVEMIIDSIVMQYSHLLLSRSEAKHPASNAYVVKIITNRKNNALYSVMCVGESNFRLLVNIVYL